MVLVGLGLVAILSGSIDAVTSIIALGALPCAFIGLLVWLHFKPNAANDKERPEP